MGAKSFQWRGIQGYQIEIPEEGGDLKPGHQDAIRMGQRRLDQASTYLLPLGKFDALGERLNLGSMNPDKK